MNFNFELTRKNYEEWALEFALNTVYDPLRPMGNVATHLLQDVVAASLVGFYDRIKPLCSRTLLWMDDAMKNNAGVAKSDSFYMERLSSGKALARWLDDGEEWFDAWADSCKWHDLAITEKAYRPSAIKTDALDDLMSQHFQARDFQGGLRSFERYYENKKISFKKALKPREFAYVLCLKELNGKFDTEDLLAAGRKMLSQNLEIWLAGGQYTRAAIWLKIVYWHQDRSLSPLQTLLKAYDDMPPILHPELSIQT